MDVLTQTGRPKNDPDTHQEVDLLLTLRVIGIVHIKEVLFEQSFPIPNKELFLEGTIDRLTSKIYEAVENFTGVSDIYLHKEESALYDDLRAIFLPLSSLAQINTTTILPIVINLSRALQRVSDLYMDHI